MPKGPVVSCTLLVVNIVKWLELLIPWLTSANKLIIHHTFRAEKISMVFTYDLLCLAFFGVGRDFNMYFEDGCFVAVLYL